MAVHEFPVTREAKLKEVRIANLTNALFLIEHASEVIEALLPVHPENLAHMRDIIDHLLSHNEKV